MFWFTLMLSPTNSPFAFFQSDPHAVIPIKLAFLSLHCSISKSDETRSVTLVNKAFLVWLMFRVLSNQHHQHRTNQKLRSWANAVFQNRGVCGQAVPSFPSPSPSPVIPFFFFLLSSRRSRRTRAETLATQARILWAHFLIFGSGLWILQATISQIPEFGLSYMGHSLYFHSVAFFIRLSISTVLSQVYFHLFFHYYM